MEESRDDKLKMLDEPWYITFRGLIIFVVVATVLALIFKFAIAPLLGNLQNLSMSELVSLAISGFAIAMSFAFYFQASHTSNTFYDNTYKFSKDVLEILGRMEGRFGEKLSHLDDNYSRMNTRLEQFSPAKAEAELNESKNKADESEDKRDELIETLIEKAQLQGAERDAFLSKLNQVEEELMSSRERAALLERRLERYQRDTNSARMSNLWDPTTPTRTLVRRRIVPVLGGVEQVQGKSLPEIKKLYNERIPVVAPSVAKQMIDKDLAHHDGSLTDQGAAVIRNIIAQVPLADRKYKIGE